MAKSLRSAGIVGLGSYLPSTRITNADLEKMVETTDEWIMKRTGIKERRRASPEEAASDLGTKAALKALENAGVTPAEVDLIIAATITPDSLLPATACIIQDNIKAEKAAAFDLMAACSGFLYALATANNYVATGMYDTVLVVATEVLTRATNWQDRGTCILFGDGAGAAVVKAVEEGKGFLSFDLGAIGAGGDLLKIPAGGSRKPATHETVDKNEHYIQMSGNEVYKFAVKIMGDASLKALEKAGLDRKDVDFLVPHQANTRIIDAALKRLELPPEKVYLNLSNYGNMSGASIPVALDETVKKGLIKTDDVVILVGFGGGLTWGACVMRWVM